VSGAPGPAQPPSDLQTWYIWHATPDEKNNVDLVHCLINQDWTNIFRVDLSAFLLINGWNAYCELSWRVCHMSAAALPVVGKLFVYNFPALQDLCLSLLHKDGLALQYVVQHFATNYTSWSNTPRFLVEAAVLQNKAALRFANHCWRDDASMLKLAGHSQTVRYGTWRHVDNLARSDDFGQAVFQNVVV
jgi:hypothetical protein